MLALDLSTFPMKMRFGCSQILSLCGREKTISAYHINQRFQRSTTDHFNDAYVDNCLEALAKVGLAKRLDVPGSIWSFVDDENQ